MVDGNCRIQCWGGGDLRSWERWEWNGKVWERVTHNKSETEWWVIHSQLLPVVVGLRNLCYLSCRELVSCRIQYTVVCYRMNLITELIRRRLLFSRFSQLLCVCEIHLLCLSWRMFSPHLFFIKFVSQRIIHKNKKYKHLIYV